MSYCRFSTDDFTCDVYVYSDVAGGWTTHVAGSRYVFDKPLPPKVPISDTRAWIDRSQIVADMIDHKKMTPIGLPHDGESFNSDTAGECADLLERLRGLGYNVPQHAIDTLRDEQAEEEPRDDGR